MAPNRRSVPSEPDGAARAGENEAVIPGSVKKFGI